MHEIEYYANDDPEQRSHLLVPADEERLTIGSLVKHGEQQLRDALVRYHGDSAGSKWKKVDVFHFAPVSRRLKTNKPLRAYYRQVFEIAAKSPSSIPKVAQQPGMITKASILGRISSFSRDYNRIFDELLSAISGRQSHPGLYYR